MERDDSANKETGRDSAEEYGIFVFTLGILLGALFGGLTGLLFAPKKGEILREDIQDFISSLPEKVEEDIKNPEGKTRRLIDKTRFGLENRIDKVNKSIRASKMAEAKKREELASGLDYP